MNESPGLVFVRPDGSKVKFGLVALRQMLVFRQTGAHSTEAGGVLLGRHILGCRDIVVDEVTIPMRGDKRMRFAFHRSQASHQQVIDSRWKGSQGTCHYLGEWHTHPEAVPIPSWIDLQDWRRRLREDVFDGGSLLFCIAGFQELRAWEGSQHPEALTLLHPTQRDKP
ncbi:Mov34/MPN/PAD-1 family protein [Stigmatella erecta]|uniref:Integrative and conjugative element protein, VC0181 family n=1 Tax=Stigmatella erecta TaxID=83460 RepID=A0A1I0KQD1_9BACT|nr:Mov34/MPN/PAD-1 family protein [Stigmatella erecta]SEU27948.1 integrative and conjugative element protein, VC0181 family [Stigmatella erecta]